MTLILIASSAILCALAYAGYRQYASARQKHLVKQGRAYLAKSDRKSALFCAQNALRHSATDLDACRLMADVLGADRSHSALLWRARVVELDPHSLNDRLALAETALTLRDYGVATQALDGVDPAQKETAAFQNLAGLVYATAGELAVAESHFAEAARLQPENQALQLNVALIRLNGTNIPARDAARATLEGLSANPSNSLLRTEALRGLTIDALRRKDTPSALAFSGGLQRETNASFGDRLLRLDALKAGDSKEFRPALAACQREAAEDPAKTYDLTLWQITRIAPSDALAWLKTLPATIQTNQPASLLIAQCYAAMNDWSGLQTWLESQSWSELDFLRHAFTAQARKAQKLDAAANVEWQLALKTAGQQKQSLLMLLSLAEQWQWFNEREELLWTIVRRYPEEQRSFQKLHDSLLAGGRTQSLMQLYNEQMKRTPGNLAIRNNLAMTALLLDAQELKPHELARSIYETSPTNALYASTYAFSLLKQGKTDQALRAMEQLSAPEIGNPSIAGYYGLILKANGNGTKARPYLDSALSSRLLPEERKLFSQAKSEL